MFLSSAHQRGLSSLSVLLDTPVEDPLLEERFHRIRAQVMCAMALHALLVDMGFGTLVLGCNRLDLSQMIGLAQGNGIISHREAGVLRDVNHLSNEAKHELVFRSRL